MFFGQINRVPFKNCLNFKSFCHNRYLLVMARIGMNAQTALTCAIYKKSLQLSNAVRQTRSLGEIVNLMAIDVERLQTICKY
jgi:hypothetical protein